MNLLLKLANRPSERALKVLAAPVAFTFLGLVIGCLGLNNIIKQQRADIEANALSVIAQASAPAILMPPAILKGGR